jgi:hypothetical protein
MLRDHFYIPETGEIQGTQKREPDYRLRHDVETVVRNCCIGVGDESRSLFYPYD